jgi:hypothetical protein
MSADRAVCQCLLSECSEIKDYHEASLPQEVCAVLASLVRDSIRLNSPQTR